MTTEKRYHPRQKPVPNSPLLLPRRSLLILAGTSGSGKSTFARKHFPSTMVASTDDCRALICDSQRNQRVSEDAFDLFYLHIEKRLKNGYPAVADSTALRKKYRLKLLEIARRYEVPPFLFFFDMAWEVCLVQDQRRRRSVGKEVLEQQFFYRAQALTQLWDEAYEAVYFFHSLQEMKLFTYRWIKESAQGERAILARRFSNAPDTQKREGAK